MTLNMPGLLREKKEENINKPFDAQYVQEQKTAAVQINYKQDLLLEMCK